jgi:hypothetical protein
MSEIFTERTIPPAAQKRPATHTQCAIETYNLHPDWECGGWALRGKGVGEYLEVKGAIYKTRLKTGPRKGKINFRSPEAGTECAVSIPALLLQQWKRRWEIETGLCSECQGSGRTLSSMGVSGTKYRTCSKCRGSGEAQISRSAA